MLGFDRASGAGEVGLSAVQIALGHGHEERVHDAELRDACGVGEPTVRDVGMAGGEGHASHQAGGLFRAAGEPLGVGLQDADDGGVELLGAGLVEGLSLGGAGIGRGGVRARAPLASSPSCRVSTSSIWLPIRCSGESELIGSWKIIEIR